MKCLYVKERYITKRSDINWRRLYSSDRVYYGEIPDEYIKTYEYDELDQLGRISFHKKSLFNRNEYKNYSEWFSYIDLNIYPDDALMFKTVCKKIDSGYSFDYLSKEMSAIDFMEYIKDNGLNICPIKL